MCRWSPVLSSCPLPPGFDLSAPADPSAKGGKMKEDEIVNRLYSEIIVCTFSIQTNGGQAGSLSFPLLCPCEAARRLPILTVQVLTMFHHYSSGTYRVTILTVRVLTVFQSSQFRYLLSSHPYSSGTYRVPIITVQVPTVFPSLQFKYLVPIFSVPILTVQVLSSNP